MSDVEATARLICRALRLNPDAELVGGYEGPRRFQWESFVAEANIILEATPKPDSPTGYGEACDSCGRSYEITYRVPDDVWLKIAPKPEAMGDHPEHALGGLLCPDCASSRAKVLGVNLRFNAGTDWPAPSPVCVESVPLDWETFGADHHALPDEYVAETVLAHYRIIGPMADGKWHAGVNEPGNFSRHHFPEMDTLEAAQAACQADFTRRMLELVNARSVESVKAEERERLAKPTPTQADVDALVKAVTEMLQNDGGEGACWDMLKHSRARKATQAALTPFQKG